MVNQKSLNCLLTRPNTVAGHLINIGAKLEISGMNLQSAWRRLHNVKLWLLDFWRCFKMWK